MINEEYCIQLSFLDCRNLFLMILAHYFAVHVHVHVRFVHVNLTIT